MHFEEDIQPAWALHHVVFKMYAIVQLYLTMSKFWVFLEETVTKYKWWWWAEDEKKGLSLTGPGMIFHRRLYLLVCVCMMCERVCAYVCVCEGRGCVICECACVLIGGLLSWGIIHLSPSGPLAADTFLILHTHTCAHFANTHVTDVSAKLSVPWSAPGVLTCHRWTGFRHYSCHSNAF